MGVDLMVYVVGRPVVDPWLSRTPRRRKSGRGCYNASYAEMACDGRIGKESRRAEVVRI